MSVEPYGVYPYESQRYVGQSFADIKHLDLILTSCFQPLSN